MTATDKYTLKECPNCGADVEGLIHHCDCCGERLYPQKTLFSYMVYDAGPFFDIQVYLNRIFDALAEIPMDSYADVIEKIEFDFWCYPIKKKTGATYYASNKRVIVTIRVEEDEYLYGTKQEKMTMIIDEMRRKMDDLQIRLQERKIDIDEGFFARIRSTLSKARSEKVD